MVGYEKGAERHLSQAEFVLAGTVAGILSRFFSQPLDVLKVKFQLQVEPIKTSRFSKYQAVGQAFRTIWKEEGLRALWSGHNPGQLLSVTYGAINFSSFEFFTKVSQEHLSLPRSPQVNFICGMASGTLATTVSYPFDVLRTRFIAQGAKNVTPSSYRSMLGGLMKIIKKEGVRAPFKGLLPALLQGAPLIGVSFTTHSFVKSILDRFESMSKGSNRLNLSGNMIAGGAAGFVSKTAIYPLDLIRRRMQFQGFQDARIGYGKNFTCWGFVHCIRITVAEEGVRGLFKGYIPSAVKTTISTSLYFTVYEQMCDLLKLMHNF
uniref:Mitochondrial thiamine pyrophosphate carrier n=1 Tax=Lygus hesperus TaxID=30085 RepID=A0A0A9W411_LYGHE